MIELNEDALICDLAETYHIYDYRSLPVKLAATLSAGLRDNSRIKLYASDLGASQDTILLAIIADRIEALRYGFSEDSAKKRNKPTPIAEAYLNVREKEATEAVSFNTGAELEAALARIRGE